MSGVLDLNTIPMAIKSNMKLICHWDMLEEPLVVNEVPAEFNEHIERIIINDDDRIPEKYYGNDNINHNKTMRNKYRMINNLVYKMFVFIYSKSHSKLRN